MGVYAQKLLPIGKCDQKKSLEIIILEGRKQMGLM